MLLGSWNTMKIFVQQIFFCAYQIVFNVCRPVNTSRIKIKCLNRIFFKPVFFKQATSTIQNLILFLLENMYPECCFLEQLYCHKNISIHVLLDIQENLAFCEFSCRHSQLFISEQKLAFYFIFLKFLMFKINKRMLLNYLGF